MASTLAIVGCQEETTTVSANNLAFGSPAFDDNGSIPEQSTADGADRSPPLTIEFVPDGTETVALIVEDSDADDFVHWVLWDLPGTRREIPEGLPASGTVPRIGDARGRATSGLSAIVDPPRRKTTVLIRIGSR
nr:YbhB/YbcL family Raf kinase inhibitor-like protein [Halorhabdus amylolytica]